MKPLDDELRELLRRKEPQAGFAERVMSRLETEPPQSTLVQHRSTFFRWPVVRWAVASAVVCIAVFAGIIRQQHQQQMRAQAERATRQAILALRITNQQIDAALERAQRVTVQALDVRKNPKQEME
ncbi:MAG: hypothetical protein EPN47_09520 [Acidobacteria bacterium]|nr:MAG: hypothetical protein EPN47_09520 [Acidobacteriota bacterium]